MGALGLRSLGLAGLGVGLCKRNSVLNVALFLNRQIPSTYDCYCPVLGQLHCIDQPQSVNALHTLCGRRRYVIELSVCPQTVTTF